MSCESSGEGRRAWVLKRKSYGASALDLNSDTRDSMIEFVTTEEKEAPKRPRSEGSPSKGPGAGALG